MSDMIDWTDNETIIAALVDESDRRLELLKEALSILYSMSNARACWPETVEAIEKELADAKEI